jgi:hypothetical protein
MRFVNTVILPLVFVCVAPATSVTSSALVNPQEIDQND